MFAGRSPVQNSPKIVTAANSNLSRTAFVDLRPAESVAAAVSFTMRGAVIGFVVALSAGSADAFMPSPGTAMFARASPLALRRTPAAWRGGRRCAPSMVAAKDAKPAGLGFDSHKAVESAPDSLCRDGTANTEMRAKFEKMCREAQDKICKAVEEVDGGATFHEDCWTREDGGGGISRVLTGGKVWEKAGCNLSVVYGSMPQEALAAANDRLKFGATDRGAGYKPGERVPFFACGLSSVMHPRNPHCPTMHFNYRYFETEGGVWWFGGGTDITPSYLDTDDMKHFHGTYKEIADKHDKEFYPKFKAWADDYFHIKHRGETRGLGGIFFDDLNDRDPDTIFAFSKECCNAVPDAYLPIIKVRHVLACKRARRRGCVFLAALMRRVSVMSRGGREQPRDQTQTDMA